MWCMKCNKNLSKCTCSDLKERLNKVVSGGHFMTKWCSKCDKHYSQCKCEEPDFCIRG